MPIFNLILSSKTIARATTGVSMIAGLDPLSDMPTASFAAHHVACQEHLHKYILQKGVITAAD
jgi:hypothetical protein